MITTCPDIDSWQAFLQGSLSEAQQGELNAHLESCTTCQRTLEGLVASQESWRGTAEELHQAPLDPNGKLGQLMARLKARTAQGETQADSAGGHELDLSFLQPSQVPGHLGRLKHYEILEILGKGAFGTVFRAHDETLDRVVAIKVLAPQLATNATARSRFKREARAAAAVSHDHVVGIHAVEETDAGVPYIVMQLISGKTLQERLDQSGPLEIREILRIGMQIASGLAAAHVQGLVHRDIKPANILLENGVERVKITDFGLARLIDDASVTQSGVIAGTPMFMAPEQAAGEAVDHRADLFSLGSVLYTMCTGRPPFRASGTMAVMKRVIEQAPTPIREINPEIPDWLCDIIAKLQAKQPVERFQTAKEVADLLGQHLAHLQQPALAPMPASVARPPVRDAFSEDSVVTDALRRVRTPALGLFVTGILYWVAIPVAFWLRFQGDAQEATSNYLWWALGVLPAIAGFVLIFGGWKMQLGEYYSLSFLAACLPLALLAEKLLALSQRRFAMTPGDWTALPFGMWALLVLTRPDVRTAFARLKKPRNLPDAPSRPGRKIAWISGLLLVTLAAIALVPIPFQQSTNVQLLANDADVQVAVRHNGEQVAVLDTGRNAKIQLAPGIYEFKARCGPAHTFVSMGVQSEGMFSGGGASGQGDTARIEIGTWTRVTLTVTVAKAAGGAEIAGNWDSNWGPVTLDHGPIKDKETVAATGSYVPEDDKKALITKGAYFPAKGRLEFSFSEPWIAVTGSADLHLSADGNNLDGTWTNSAGESGIWTMIRKSNAPGEKKVAAVSELQHLVVLQEKNVELAKNRFEAGVISPDDMTIAEIDLLEAKIRLAEAEKKPTDVTEFGRQMIGRYEKRVTWVKELFRLGRVPEADVTKMEQRLIETRLRFNTLPAQPREAVWQDPSFEETKDGVMVQTGALVLQPGVLRAQDGEHTVFFPRPYRKPPYLELTVAGALRIDHEIKDQTASGFRLKITASVTPPGATPMLKWKAAGQPVAPKQATKAQVGSVPLDRSGQFQVNYPQAYERPPHLALHLVDVFGNGVDCGLLEQTGTGFKINVLGVAHELGRTSRIEWRAVGVLFDPAAAPDPRKKTKNRS
jgi:anti-sigma factor RsiW